MREGGAAAVLVASLSSPHCGHDLCFGLCGVCICLGTRGSSNRIHYGIHVHCLCRSNYKLSLASCGVDRQQVGFRGGGGRIGFILVIIVVVGSPFRERLIAIQCICRSNYRLPLDQLGQGEVACGVLVGGQQNWSHLDYLPTVGLSCCKVFLGSFLTLG